MHRLDRRRALVGLVAVATIAIAAVAIFGVPAGTSPLTYREASGVAEVLGIAAGTALIAAGLVAVAFGPSPLIGGLLLALAATWFAQDLEALGDGADVTRAVASGLGPWIAVLAFHLALALPDGRLSRGRRAAALAAYVSAAVSWVGTVTLRDPFRDVYCWRGCGNNPLLVHAAPDVARGFIAGGQVLAIVLGLAAIGVVARRLAQASMVARSLLWPTLIPVAFVAACEAARGIALLAAPLEDPDRAAFMAVYLARGAAIAALAVGVLWTVLHALRTRSRVTRLAAELGDAPATGALRHSLAVALRDPSVDVLYWIAATGRYVDADGVARALPDDPLTRITRRGRLIAVIVHDTSALSSAELRRLLGPSARLAIENEALRAEVLAQLEQLQRSRARIVATGDESRRRLERDLHDGAQQRLLTVVLDLRLARADAQGALGETLGHISDEIDRAFGELRELAHGIYPAILTEAGLEAALPALADVAPVAVELGEVTDGRLPASVEASAYLAVDEAIRDAAARLATAVQVEAVVRDGRLVVIASDDGSPRETSLVHVADRVGALGGVLEVAPRLLRAEIPCG